MEQALLFINLLWFQLVFRLLRRNPNLETSGIFRDRMLPYMNNYIRYNAIFVMHIAVLLLVDKNIESSGCH